MKLIYEYDPYQPIDCKTPADADEALAELLAGNQRFAHIVDCMHRVTLGEKVKSPDVIPVSPMSLGLPLWADGTLDQAAYALVLGCSDARAPVEQIFDQAFNSLFVVRIAGNVLGTECLGSIDFAVRNLKTLRLVLVLGHSGCGAVTAAVDTYLNPQDFSDIACTHALRSLVDRIMIAVRGAAKALVAAVGPAVIAHRNYRAALIEFGVYLNAAVTAYDLRRELKSLDNADLRVMFAVYDLETLRVHAAPENCPVGSLPQQPPFGEAPAHAEEFNELAGRLARHVIELYSLS
jgi:carbonic anhydrase